VDGRDKQSGQDERAEDLGYNQGIGECGKNRTDDKRNETKGKTMNRSCGGKPRAGKTKRLVIWVEEQLRAHKRPIVTNMALKLQPWVDGKGKAHKGLIRTLMDKYGETFDAERRIYLLKHEEVPRFYGIRPIIPEDSWEPVKIEEVPRSDMWKIDTNKYPGVCYVIDEAEVYFPSAAVDAQRANHENPELLQWAKQAGRAGDDAIFLSQNLTWISIKLRKTCQECWWMVNHAHIPFSIFRRPDHITEETYMNCPPTPGEVYLRKTKLAYNREEIEGCYNTAEGVGVTGNSAADIGQRAKGLHWSFIPAGVIAIALLGGFGLKVFGDMVKAGMGGQLKPAVVATSKTNAQGKVVSLEVGSDGFTEEQRSTLFAVFGKMTNYLGSQVKTQEVGKVAGHPTETNLTVVALVNGSAGTAVGLSDGSTFLASGKVQEYGRELLIDGVWYRRGKGEVAEVKKRP